LGGEFGNRVEYINVSSEYPKYGLSFRSEDSSGGFSFQKTDKYIFDSNHQHELLREIIKTFKIK